MSELQNHIEQISRAIDEWLSPDNGELKHAIEKTIHDNRFGIEDIRHQIRTLKNSVTEKSLRQWAERSSLEPGSLVNKNILCLHAGNIPLVGFQDLMSVMMTCGNYYGKISNKDPYLLPSLLNVLKRHFPDRKIRWDTKLQNLSAFKSDAVLFAGSEKTAGIIKEKLKNLGIIDGNTPLLMRTAHFSIAYLPNKNPESMQDLTEAVFRYGGAGCRSVGLVVSPFDLAGIQCEFTDYIESFWLKNPQHSKPPEKLKVRFAYNKAMERDQAWLGDFLIEENMEKPSEKFILYWVQGDEETLKKAVRNFRAGLQSVYSTAEFIGEVMMDLRIEPLSSAQSPPLWWRPDQTDSIIWLQEKVADH